MKKQSDSENAQSLIPGRSDIYTKWQRTRQHLIEATKQLVAEKDVDAISIADIARNAEMSRGTVYNYFKTVEAALSAAAIELIDEFAGRQQQFGEIETDPARVMAYGVYAALYNANDNKTLAWFYIRYAPRSQEVQVQLDAVMQQILENGISKHRFALTQKQIPATLIFIRGAVMHALRVLLETNQTTLLKTDIVVLVLMTLGLSTGEATAIAQTIADDFREIADSLN